MIEADVSSIPVFGSSGILQLHMYVAATFC